MLLNKKDIKQVVQVLNAGGVAIVPTDTIYGLICDASNPRALLKIYQVKERQFGKAFPILVGDFEILSQYAMVNNEQKKLVKSAKKPTTFILKTKKNLSPLATVHYTGAFRIPKDRWLKDLFKQFDRPIVATSVNLAGKQPISDPRKYREVFGKKAEYIDAVVFAGINKKRKGSKIIDLTKKPYKILRA